MIDLLVTSYPWIKSLHVIAVIAWMAGLFYLPRLFVHHCESGRSPAATDRLFATMETKLLKVIMTPAMLAAWVFGLLLVATPGAVDWSAVWPWTKAAAVIAMTWFHVWCARERRVISAGGGRSGRTYRMMNEVPTVLLIVIVVSVIARPF